MVLDSFICATALIAVLSTAVVLLLVWIGVYATVSAPINRELTAADDAGSIPSNSLALQSKWDHVINARASLQGAAVAALCVALAV